MHIAVLLLANAIWGLLNAFVVGGIDPEIAKLDIVNQIISILILSIVVA